MLATDELRVRQLRLELRANRSSASLATILDDGPALAAPEHAAIEDALGPAFGPDALEPVPA